MTNVLMTRSMRKIKTLQIDKIEQILILLVVDVNKPLFKAIGLYVLRLSNIFLICVLS